MYRFLYVIYLLNRFVLKRGNLAIIIASICPM